jgi:hypothetical protein
MIDRMRGKSFPLGATVSQEGVKIAISNFFSCQSGMIPSCMRPSRAINVPIIKRGS